RCAREKIGTSPNREGRRISQFSGMRLASEHRLELLDRSCYLGTIPAQEFCRLPPGVPHSEAPDAVLFPSWLIALPPLCPRSSGDDWHQATRRGLRGDRPRSWVQPFGTVARYRSA